MHHLTPSLSFLLSGQSSTETLKEGKRMINRRSAPVYVWTLHRWVRFVLSIGASIPIKDHKIWAVTSRSAWCSYWDATVTELIAPRDCTWKDFLLFPISRGS